MGPSAVPGCGARLRAWLGLRVIARAGSLRRLSLRREPGLRVLEIPGFDRRRLGGAAYYALALPIALAWASGPGPSWRCS